MDNDNVIIEINGLKIAYNKDFCDCASTILITILKLAIERTLGDKVSLLANRKLCKWEHRMNVCNNDNENKTGLSVC